MTECYIGGIVEHNNQYINKTASDMNESPVTHDGIVEEVSGESLKVRILVKSACASCHAKGMCSLADMEEKIIDVPNKLKKPFQQGERVTVMMSRSMGYKAVILGYIVPFLLLVGSIVVAVGITGNEGLSALLALGLLVPYYVILYLLRDRLRNTFVFEIV